MARPRKFDEAEVKSALRDVFWKNGYDGTSYADIMEATGLNKGSLYASFGDKRALYQHAIADYARSQIMPGVAMLNDDTIDPQDRIMGLFNSLVKGAQTPQGRWGCLLCNAAIDQAPSDKQTEETVKASLNRLKAAIIHTIGDEEKADHILAAYYGARVLVKAGFEKERMKNIRSQVLATL